MKNTNIAIFSNKQGLLASYIRLAALAAYLSYNLNRPTTRQASWGLMAPRYVHFLATHFNGGYIL